ncbi:MAG: hypothetical protein LUI07_02570 [Lachnospiraceae bacterium]|nr:hypothetical protein [Lachnospiraceae bacterium]
MIKKTILKDYHMKSKRIMAVAFSLMLEIRNSAVSFTRDEAAALIVDHKCYDSLLL